MGNIEHNGKFRLIKGNLTVTFASHFTRLLNGRLDYNFQSQGKRRIIYIKIIAIMEITHCGV